MVTNETRAVCGGAQQLRGPINLRDTGDCVSATDNMDVDGKTEHAKQDAKLEGCEDVTWNCSPMECHPLPTSQIYTFHNARKPSKELRIPAANMEKLSKGETIAVYNPCSCTLMTVRVFKPQTTISTETPCGLKSREALVSTSPMEDDINLHVKPIEGIATIVPTSEGENCKEPINSMGFEAPQQDTCMGKRRKIARQRLVTTSSTQTTFVLPAAART